LNVSWTEILDINAHTTIFDPSGYSKTANEKAVIIVRSSLV